MPKSFVVMLQELQSPKFISSQRLLKNLSRFLSILELLSEAFPLGSPGLLKRSISSEVLALVLLWIAEREVAL